MFDSISIATALGAGILTFLAPCTFVTLPVFITYIIGATAEEIKEGGKRARVKAIINTVFYALGFTIVFVALGMTAAFVGNIFNTHKDIFTKVGALLVILFGVFILFGTKIKFLNFLYHEKKGTVSKRLDAYKYLRAFIIGVTSAFAWTPCVGPILGSILFYASATTSAAWEGGLLLFVYSLGITLPFFVFAYLVGIGFRLNKNISRHIGEIYKVSGVILIILGLILLTNMSGFFYGITENVFKSLGYVAK